jgi:hypothetical protein
MPPFDDAWRAFIEKALYADMDSPWRDDPAFAVIATHASLRDSIGGHDVPALRQAIRLVRAMA